MVEIRKAFEDEALTWKGVSSRPMMGCLCYFYDRKVIGFLVTNGIVVMKLSEKDQKELKEKFGGKPFEMAGQTGRLWVTPLSGPKDVGSVLPSVKKRYEEAFSTHGKT
ncbi:TfoX/Sxy family protein [Candidatus Bathyarchaeota archaeon]|nr:MAG: TfoX/Sxy family protein [Candidatus Bathyarchaeota archaeon]